MLTRELTFLRQFPHLWIMIDNRMITDYLIGLFHKASIK